MVAVLDLHVGEAWIAANILSGSLPTDIEALLRQTLQNEQRKVPDSRVTFTG